MSDDEDRYALTEEGLYEAMEMHQKILDGWTLEQVAAYNDRDVLTVRVILAMFYAAADNCDVDLGVYIPDTLDG